MTPDTPVPGLPSSDLLDRAARALASGDAAALPALAAETRQIDDPHRRYVVRRTLVEQALRAAREPGADAAAHLLAAGRSALVALDDAPSEPVLLSLAGVALFGLGAVDGARALLKAAQRLDAATPDVAANLDRVNAARRGTRRPARPAGLAAEIADLERRARALAPRARLDDAPTLSLCMIVRDEEAVLDRALSSVQGVADEIVVVDTGSTDRTVEIAERHGATVLHFPWIDDFAAARNFGIDAATSDWILVLDADEALHPDDGPRLRELLRAPWREACVLSVVSHIGDAGAATVVQAGGIRVFRNRPQHRYVGRVHEAIAHCLPTDVAERRAMSGVRIDHVGYLTETRDAKNKTDRNLELLERQRVEDAPTAYLFFNLGTEYLSDHQVDRAIADFARAWELLDHEAASGHGSFGPILAARYSLALRAVQRFEDAVAVADDGIARFGETADLRLERAWAHLGLDDHEQAEADLRRALELGDAVVAGVAGAGTFVAATVLGDLLVRRGRAGEALELALDALRTSPGYDAARLVAAAAHLALGHPGAASDVLDDVAAGAAAAANADALRAIAAAAADPSATVPGVALAMLERLIGGQLVALDADGVARLVPLLHRVDGLEPRARRETLARLYSTHGLHDLAGEEWAAACEEHGPDPAALFGLAQVAAEQGRAEDAEVFLAGARELLDAQRSGGAPDPAGDPVPPAAAEEPSAPSDPAAAVLDRAEEALAAGDPAALPALAAATASIEDPHRRYVARRGLAERALRDARRHGADRAGYTLAAAECAIIALEDQPSEPVLLNLGGVALFALGALDGARALLEAADRLDPATENLAANLEALRAAPRRPRPDGTVAELERRALQVAPRARLDDRATLSLCMIVRDEEAVLDRALSSVRGVADELVIVDTGSTDRTVEIAERHGARVLHFEWIDDFAAARNFGIEAATSDWILVLDADEALYPEDGPRLRELLRAPWREAYLLTVINQVGDGTSGAALYHDGVRVFRNRPQHRFVGAIHEDMSHCLPADARERQAPAGVRVDHVGYLEDVRETKDKSRRNLEILERQRATEPFLPFLAFNLGTEYLALREYDRATADLGHAWRTLVDTGGVTGASFGAALATRYVAALRFADRLDDAVAVAQEARAELGDYADVLVEEATARIERRELDAAEACLRQALEIGDATDKFAAMSGAGTFLSAGMLAELRLGRGGLDEAVALAEQALAVNPEHHPALLVLAEAALSAGDTARAAEIAATVPADSKSAPDAGARIALVRAAAGASVAPPAEALTPLTQLLEGRLHAADIDGFARLLPLLDRLDGVDGRARRETRAKLYLDHGFLDLAAEEWAAACDEHGPDAAALLGLARVAVERGDAEDARIFAEGARELAAAEPA